MVKLYQKNQKNKTNCHTKSPFQKYFLPKCRFFWLIIDIVDQSSFTYSLSLTTTTPSLCLSLRNLLPHMLWPMHSSKTEFIFFGIPSYLASHKGASYTNQLFQQMASVLDIKTIQTRAYNIHSNS